MEELTVPPVEASMYHIYMELTFVDDVIEIVLDKAAAVRARKKEISYFKGKGVYTQTRREPSLKIHRHQVA